MFNSSARQPRLTVLINGQQADGVITAEIRSTSFLSADRFSIRSALAATDAAIWSTLPILVDISVALDGASASLITGEADELIIDPIRGEVSVSGRDLTSRLISAQTDDSFQNSLSSDVAATLAMRAGLSAVVQPTQTLIGRYYQSDRTRTTLAQHSRGTTAWDLLCWLAQTEGYDVWVSGRTLYFQPPNSITPTASVSPNECISMELQRALDIAAGVTVNVKSWDSVGQSIVSGSATTTPASNGSSRTIVQPNLSSNDASTLATRVAATISSHERSVRYEMPGDLVTAPRTVIALSGTQTDFDGAYVIYEIERRLTYRHGFTQTVEARSLPWMPS